MEGRSSRTLVLVLTLISLGLLLPGLVRPVLSIRGVLTPEGVASMTPVVLEKGLDDDTVAALKAMMNPAMVAFVEATGGDIRKMIIERLGPRLTVALQQGVGDIEVYRQERSIMGAVKNLYEVGSPLPATLILLFSVIVPLMKALLVVWAMFAPDPGTRRRVTGFVETIAKWSMADVFVVALFITYLAAEATQASAGGPALVAFDAAFGPGFYWFTAYCLFSLAIQQYSARKNRDRPH